MWRDVVVWCTSRENPRIRALNEIARSMTAAPGAAAPSSPGSGACG